MRKTLGNRCCDFFNIYGFQVISFHFTLGLKNIWERAASPSLFSSIRIICYVSGRKPVVNDIVPTFPLSSSNYSWCRHEAVLERIPSASELSNNTITPIPARLDVSSHRPLKSHVHSMLPSMYPKHIAGGSAYSTFKTSRSILDRCQTLHWPRQGNFTISSGSKGGCATVCRPTPRRG